MRADFGSVNTNTVIPYKRLKEKLSSCRICKKGLISAKANRMNQNKEADLTSIIVGLVCIIMAVTGGLSMFHIISRLNGWQAAGYALIGGICIALFAVILNEIISFIKRH